MAAQGMIRPEGDRFRVVFPYGGRQHEVHSLESYELAHTVLMCLTTWAMADLQRSLDSALGGPASGGAPAAMGSPQQLVAELQACVDWYNVRDVHMFHADMPAFSWLMEAAVTEGYASVARQLLVAEPSLALTSPFPDSLYAGDVPLHQAALGGHAAVFRLLLAAAPGEAATAMYETDSYSEWSLMHSAASGGSVAVIEALLELHPEAPLWTSSSGHIPLHEACGAGHLEAARLLLKAAPATATAVDSDGCVPLHWAAGAGAVTTDLMLQAAPHTATAADSDGDLPLHLAAYTGRIAAVELLLQAAPLAALMQNAGRCRPFHQALLRHHQGTARTLLPVSGLSPAQLLDALAQAGPDAQPLYADLATRFPLSAAEWECVPTPCADLGRALPVVLARSDAEARQLVRRLPAADRQRLRLAALCLSRTQHRCHTFLPAPLVRAILAQCLF